MKTMQREQSLGYKLHLIQTVWLYLVILCKIISESLRSLIVSLGQEGKTPSQILEIVKSQCTLSTIKRVLRDPNRRKSLKLRRGRQPKISGNLARRVTYRLRHSKVATSIRRIAAKEHIGDRTIRRFMASKGINVYKLLPRHLISAAHAQKRKTLCNGLRKKYRVADIPNFVFCDEMYVVAGETGNHQNDRCFGKSWELISDDRKFKNKKKSPLRAMVFAAVWRDGRKRLIVLKSGFRLNQTTYIETCLKPLIEDVSQNMNTDLAILYQDKAPCHAGKKTQRFLEEHACSFVPAHIVPPSSPDLGPPSSPEMSWTTEFGHT